VDVSAVVSNPLNLIWPTEMPLLVALCFVVTFVAWRLRGDVVSAYVFGFSFPFAFIWTTLVVWMGLDDVLFPEYPTMVGMDSFILYGEAVVDALLFGACSASAYLALTDCAPLRRPAAVVGTLIAAATLHVHLVFSSIFQTLQVPPWEMRLYWWLT
jgi:hypothetical protein